MVWGEVQLAEARQTLWNRALCGSGIWFVVLAYWRCRYILRCADAWLAQAYSWVLVPPCLCIYDNVLARDKCVNLREGGGIIRIYPLLGLVWIWGFGRTLPYGTEILPATAGLDSYGGVTLTAIYAAARWCSVNKIEEKIKAGWLLAALPVLWFLTGIGLGDYNSPFAFALAGVMFLLFLKVKVPMLLCRSVSFLAPSMFSVYLIHTNEVGARFIKYIANIFDCPAIAVFVSAIIVLICATLLDIPRRFCMARFIRN